MNGVLIHSRFHNGSALFTAILALTLMLGRISSAQDSDQKIDQINVRSSVRQIAELIRSNYFDPDVAQKVSHDLQTRLADGQYQNIKTTKELASLATTHLFALTRDRHLVVEARNRTPGSSAPPNGSNDNPRELAGKRSNYGIQKVEIMAGNIGYLNLTSFFRANEAGETLASAMALLANVDALIVDMRFNLGGSPGTVALLSSYFFEEPELELFEIVPRSGEAQKFSTSADVNNRNKSRPLYVLTASNTFSAGEGFAFIMQDRRRAVVVGAQTAGAANPGRPYKANDLFEVTIPNGQIRAAVSRKNWEGNGVLPDVPVDEETALDVARRLALKKLITQTTDANWRNELEKVLEASIPK